MKSISLSRLLRDGNVTRNDEGDSFKKELEKLQLKMLTIQQGVWHQKLRVIIVFEGFDAAGKGGAIRKLTEVLDPRGVRVHPIGPPSTEEHGRHRLYRFWTKLPEPGTIAIFDRSWYGRVLVERVEQLTEEKNWKRAYTEIKQFEKMLYEDGIIIIKIFLAITKDEQLSRFESRLKDPYKQWKLSKDDLRARKKWNEYVKASDKMFEQTSCKGAPWRLIPANNKNFARKEALAVITSDLRACELWMKKQVSRFGKRTLADVMKDLDDKGNG